MMHHEMTAIKESKTNCFEELPVWQKAMDLALRIYKLTEENRHIRNDLGFKDQLRRAALSVSDAIATGFEFHNQLDFYRCLRTARAACSGVRNKILFMQNMGFIPNDIAEIFLDDLISLGGEIDSLLNKMKRTKENSIAH